MHLVLYFMTLISWIYFVLNAVSSDKFSLEEEKDQQSQVDAILNALEMFCIKKLVLLLNTEPISYFGNSF